MNDKLCREYGRIRAKTGAKAKHALCWARELADAPRSIDWEEGRGSVYRRAEWTEGRFQVVAELRPDECPDTSYLGEYTSKGGPECIGREARGDCGHHEFKYWRPSITYASHYRGLRALHYGRHEADCLARSYVLRDYKRHEALNRGDWSIVAVGVRVYAEGVELGRASCGGVEWDPDPDTDHIDSIARECADEALSDARNALARLCCV